MSAFAKEGNAERLRERVAALQADAESLCAMLGAELTRVGLAVPAPRFDQTVLALSRDPFSGEESLLGDWFNARHERAGGLVFHADGSCYAEWDVIRVHPRNPQVFVEAVCAWGKAGAVTAELRLLPMP